MKTKVVVLCMLATVIALAGVAQAFPDEIVMITNNQGNNQSYIDWLTSTYPGVNIKVGTYDDPLGDAQQKADLEGADLIIIPRSSNSGDYNDGDEEEYYNSLEVPILLHSSFISRDNRWNWHTGDRQNEDFSSVTVIDSSDPIFDGVDTSGGSVAIYSIDKSISVAATATDAGFGSLISTPSVSNHVAIARWTGEEDLFWSGSDHGGPGAGRILFCLQSNSFTDFTDDGKKMVENAIKTLLFPGNFAPKVDAGTDQHTEFSGPSMKIPLSGSVTDDGKPIPDNPPIPSDPNKLTYSWSITGEPDPGGANAASIVDNALDGDGNSKLDPNLLIKQEGVYEITLSASDGEKDSNDTVRITVWPSGHTGLVAYWDFEEGAGDVLTDQSDGVLEPNMTTLSFDGPYKHDLDIYTSQPGAHDPNWADGPDSSSTPLLNLADFGAALFFDPSYNQAAINEILNPDEDFLNGLTECTIMCWIKSSEIDTDRGFLNFDDPAGNDQKGFRYDTDGADTGGDDVLKGGFSSQSSSNELETSANMQTTEWQHVAMVWKADENFKWYINSIQDTGQDTKIPLGTPLGRYEKIIVGRGGRDNPGGTSSTNGDFGWHGLIDEVRIYDRALSAAEVLAASGIENTTPQVDAGYSYITRLDDLPLTTLAGTVGDGPPGDVADADVVWSITTSPGGANASVTKTSSDWANPTADFTTDTVGTYEITLTATDTTGLTESDTLEIQVAVDACGAAQLSASWTGFSIYDSDQNCVIDLIDYADFAAYWLEDLRLTAPEEY